MNIHLSTDTVVSMGIATEWNLDATRHIAECSDCREHFCRLAAVHRALQPNVEVNRELTQRIMRSLDETVRQPRARWAPRMIELLNPLLAALTTIFAITFIVGQSGAPLGPLHRLGAALVVAASTFWWNRAMSNEAQQ